MGATISHGICCGREAKLVTDEDKQRLAAVKALPGPVEELQQLLDKRLYLPGGPDYDVARGDSLAEPSRVAWDGHFRQTWNLDDVGFPSAIATVESVAEVQAVVNYAAQHCLDSGMLFCVACGRHSHQCMLDSSFVLDLQRLSEVQVDPEKKIAKVGGGAQQGALDLATEPYGLATTAGHNASTGCGGLILQGGHGFLERTHGMVVDNLVAAEVVLADGRLVSASDTENPDLFWALKGGGGNFGVVVSFSLQLHAISQVFAGQRVHVPMGLGPFKSREELVVQFVEKTVGGPDEATGLLVLPGGGPVVEMLLWVGNPADGKTYFDSKSVGWPVLKDSMGTMSYHSDVQRFYPPGNSNSVYQSGVLLPELPEAAVAKIADLVSGARAPNSESAVIILPLGGKVLTVAPEATAYHHREMKFWLLISGQFKPNDKDSRAKVVQWVRDVKEAMLPFSAGAQYGVLSEVQAHDAATAPNNAESGDGTSLKLATNTDGGAIGCMLNTLDTRSRRNIYGPNLQRLQQLKNKYDPQNLFRATDNIIPSKA